MMGAMKVEPPPEQLSRLSPTASSTSDSGSDSGTDSDSTSEDSGDENVNPKQRNSPVPVEQPAASPKAEEETKPRWNLASYLDQNGVKSEPVPSPQVPTTSPLQNMTSNVLPLNQKRVSNRDEDSDSNDSTKDIHSVLAEIKATTTLLSSLSDSDSSTKKKYLKKRKRVPVPSVNINGNISDSDSGDEYQRTPKVHKPVNRASPKPKVVDSNSDSDVDKITLHCEDSGKTWTSIAPANLPPDKPKLSRRGRPRKQPGEKRPGRPPNSKKSAKGKVLPKPQTSDDESTAHLKHRKKQSKKDVATSSSDSDISDHGKRSYNNNNNNVESDQDSVKTSSKKYNNPTQYNKHVDSDHEDWSERKKKCYNHLFDNRENVNKAEYNKKRQKPARPTKRKGKPDLSKEMLPTTTDSDSDSDANHKRTTPIKKPPPKTPYSSPSNSDSDDKPCGSSDSDNERNCHSRLSMNMNKENKGKVESDCKAVQDKKKCDTLKKLFIQKRDSEGGKGGGKGGAKGGKGKGGVIIVDGDYERSSSSVEDETMPTTISNTSMLPISNNNETRGSTHSLSYEPIKSVKTESINSDSIRSNNANNNDPSIMVRIDLSRLHFVPKPTKTNKKRSEEMRKLGEKSDTRQDFDTSIPINGSEIKPCDNFYETKRTSSSSVIIESDSDVNNKKSKSKNNYEQSKINNKGPNKRKRQNSTSSLSSLSTVSSNVSLNSRRHEHKKDKSHKSKRRKEDKSQRNGEENFVNVPPTNHDREGGPRTPPCTTTLVNRSNNSVQVATREYHSYFERTDDQLDEEG